VCSGLIACGLMFSVSRSAIVGMAGAAVILLIGWSARRRLQALGVLVAFLAGMKVLVPGLLGTFYSLFANLGSDSSIQYRTHDYTTASIEISRHFWLGRGLGTWYAPKHEVFDNQYLLSLVEIGALGMVTFIGIFLAGLYAATRSRFRAVDAIDRDLALTLAAMIVVPILGCATFDLAAFSTASAVAFLTAGAAGALWRITQASHPRASVPPRSAPVAVG
jgi:O-antigen ligase